MDKKWLNVLPLRFLEILRVIPKKGSTTNCYIQGITLCLFSIVVISQLIILSIFLTPLKTNTFTFIFLYLAISSIFIPFFSGKKFISTIKPTSVGVPLFMGKLVEYFTYSPGLIWKLPEPIMGYSEVDMREIRCEIIATALAKDNTPIKIDFIIRTIVINPLATLFIDKLEESVVELGLRESRTFSSEHKSVNLPPLKGELREHIIKNCNREMETPLDKKPEEVRPWGLSVSRVFVKDIRLPGKMEDANAQIEIEKSLCIARIKRINSLTKAKSTLDKKLKLKDKSISEEKILNIIQGEFGTIKRIEVSGTDSFTRAASILADTFAPKSINEPKEPEEDEEVTKNDKK